MHAGLLEASAANVCGEELRADVMRAELCNFSSSRNSPRRASACTHSRYSNEFVVRTLAAVHDWLCERRASRADSQQRVFSRMSGSFC
jgi:hypothetical protein